MVKIILDDNSEYLASDWMKGYKITTSLENNEVLIKANKEGLISLAGVLLELANNEKEIDHIHLDEYNYSLLK